MSFLSSVSKPIPGFMALGLMGKSVGMAKRGFSTKKNDKGLFMRDSIQIIAGIPMVGVVAGQVNLLP